jgi:hypothetical protein
MSGTRISGLLGKITVLVIICCCSMSAYASWPEVEKLLASDGDAYDRFGVSVSISGDFAIVGANYDDDNGDASGSAYIFYYDGTSWSEQAKLTASDAAAGDWFGYSVSISGDYAIVGALYDEDNGYPPSGSAYIFKRDGTNWNQQVKLTAADGNDFDEFGYSVSVSGDYAIVGAQYGDGNEVNSGSAYIFKREGTNWSEQAKLTASDGVSGHHFGNSVSISGDYAIVGAPYNDDNGSQSGSAYIFKRDGTNWPQQDKLLAADGAVSDYFGYSVSISGDYAIVGACGDDDSGTVSGSAYIFKRDGTNWSEQAKLLASDGAAHDYFGLSVSLSSAYAIVGAYQDEDNGPLSGSAYIFERDGTNWSQQPKLTAADSNEYDHFGCSVSISGSYAVVGAYRDEDSGTDSGSAYIFSGLAEIHGTKWHDTTYEEPIEGWRIYIDVNENGQFDAGEQNDITDANGNYVLTVPAGIWVVAEEVRPCWERTYPGGDGTYSVILETGEITTGYSFGNARPGEIHPSTWKQQEQDKLVASDGAGGDWFGRSVSVSGACAIVGADGDDDYGNDSGSAYIFTPNDVNCGKWDQQAKLTGGDAGASDYFGRSVSISGAYAIVAAYGDHDNGTNSGAAYIFFYDGTVWSEHDKLLASDGDDYDYFGRSVSISGDYAIVGADGDDDNGSQSGSAYIFKRDGTNWSQQTKLTAAEPAPSSPLMAMMTMEAFPARHIYLGAAVRVGPSRPN